jgi:hypothetical protein
MTVELLGIEDAGNIEKERLVLKASARDQLGNFAIFRCEATDDGLPYSGNISKTFWFPNRMLAAGDLVVLYSRKGRDSRKKDEGGQTSYFYYWDLEGPLWTPGALPVLVQTPGWDVGKPISAPIAQSPKA